MIPVITIPILGFGAFFYLIVFLSSENLETKDDGLIAFLTLLFCLAVLIHFVK